MIFDCAGIRAPSPWDQLKLPTYTSLALLDANGDAIDYVAFADTTTGEVERYMTSNDGTILTNHIGNPIITQERYPPPLKIVDMKDLSKIYYEEGMSLKEKSNTTSEKECTCTSNQLMWGGCICGSIVKSED